MLTTWNTAPKKIILINVIEYGSTSLLAPNKINIGSRNNSPTIIKTIPLIIKIAKAFPKTSSASSFFPSPITSAEQPFLTSLYIRNGATQDDISSHLNIDKAATTRVIQSLMEKGYVTKEKDPNDF